MTRPYVPSACLNESGALDDDGAKDGTGAAWLQIWVRSVYREIFRSEDFMKVSFGAILIPLGFFLFNITVAPVNNLGLLDIALLLSIAVNGLPIIDFLM